MHTIDPTMPTAYPSEAMQCFIECQEGTCTDPIESKHWAHAVVLGWSVGQAAAAGPPGPCPCPGPCSLADLKKLHAHMKAGGKMQAIPNWLTTILALISTAGPALMTLVQEFLALFAQPTPAPAKP